MCYISVSFIQENFIQITVCHNADNEGNREPGCLIDPLEETLYFFLFSTLWVKTLFVKGNSRAKNRKHYLLPFKVRKQELK